jgi:hypothetical protein
MGIRHGVVLIIAAERVSSFRSRAFGAFYTEPRDGDRTVQNDRLATYGSTRLERKMKVR